MQNRKLLTTVIVISVFACTIFLSDGLIYLVTAMMGLAILGAIRYNRPLVMQITRWAKANPKKAQGLLAFLQIALMALGILAGNNLRQLGFELSTSTAYVLTAFIAVGFASVHFLPKRSTIAIPRVVNKNRLAYLSIALPSFIMMVLFGNRIGDMYPDSPVTHAVQAMDRAIFQDYETDESDLYYTAQETDLASPKAVFAGYTTSGNEAITPSTGFNEVSFPGSKDGKHLKKSEKKKLKMLNLLEKQRLEAVGISTGLGIFLIIILIITSCAGICIMALGVGAGPIIGGAAVLGASIFGLVKVIKGMSLRKKR